MMTNRDTKTIETTKESARPHPYCHGCGGDEDNLRYLDTYANGEKWECIVCGEKFFWDKEPDYLDT